MADLTLPETPAKAQTWRQGDVIFLWLSRLCAFLVPALIGGIFLALLIYSLPAIKKFGPGFLASPEWNPVLQEFGAASSIFGTVVSTFLAMLWPCPSAWPSPFSWWNWRPRR